MKLLYCLSNKGIKVWGNSLIPFVQIPPPSHNHFSFFWWNFSPSFPPFLRFRFYLWYKIDVVIETFLCQKLLLEVRISYILADTFTDNAIILHFPLLCITFLFLEINYKMKMFWFRFGFWGLNCKNIKLIFF